MFVKIAIDHIPQLTCSYVSNHTVFRLSGDHSLQHKVIEYAGDIRSTIRCRL